MRIYLADLTHTTVTVSIDTFPLGIGYIAAYTKEVMGPGHEFELFRYPDDAFDRIDEDVPDVIGVSNYCWNFELAAWVAEYVKSRNPDALTIMGGPNFPVDEDLQEEFLRKLPQIDYYVVGEGETTFAHLLQRYQALGQDKKKLYEEFKANPFPSTLAYDRESGKMLKGEGFKRSMALEELPSPYRSGVMDKFFDGKLNPMIQTNRGCPFTCTFCLEGNSSYTVVNKFELDGVKADLDYITERVHKSSTLFITDSNFGMFPRDVDTATYLRSLQDKNDWPKSINCTTGKNNPNGIIKVVDLVNGAIRISSSVQSMDKDVLLNVRRKNIKLDSYAKVQEEVRKRSMQSVADLILCLPGESKDSHFEGVKTLLDSGVQRVLPYQLMLLHGTQINNKETHQNYEFRIKHRVVPRNFGNYREKKIFETEGIVVGTNSLSYQDYLECRKFHLILEAYYKENPFNELIAYVNSCGILTSDFFIALYERLQDTAPEDLREVFNEFSRETQSEIFDSREELLDFMGKHYEDVKEGEVGGNLLQKYSVQLWFSHLHSLVSYAVSVAREMVVAKQAELKLTEEEVDQQLYSIEEYLKAIFVNVLDHEDIRNRKTVNLYYDIAAWKARNFEGALRHYMEDPPEARSGLGKCGRDYVFEMDDNQARYVEDKIDVFGKHAQGVGKMLTRMFLKDLRRGVHPKEKEKESV